jgi:hypothetical protein
MTYIKSSNHSFIYFQVRIFVSFVMAMHDTSILRLFSKYCYDIFTVFDEIQLCS